MKFFTILNLSLIGTSVAAPLDRIAISARAVAARAESDTAGDAAAKALTASKAISDTAGGAANSGGAASGESGRTPAQGAAKRAGNGNGNNGNGNTGTGNRGGSSGQVQTAPDLQRGGTPGAPGVQYAAGAFANDATTVSNSLNALGSETNPEMIRALATVAFTAESDEDQRRNVLNTAGGSAAKNANALIVKNTPAVLDGLQNIMNDPTVATTRTNLQSIERARNPNILPSITELSNAAMMMSGLQQLAVEFPQTSGSSGSASGGGQNGNQNGNNGGGNNNSGGNNSGVNNGGGNNGNGNNGGGNNSGVNNGSGNNGNGNNSNGNNGGGNNSGGNNARVNNAGN
ncbi:hypothetical protein WAI453_010401 [Rhynchosporium graminicola]|uniref:Ppe family protein n=1 Tax=Rhynchosporium graminicola TaxID=2792576 RepID=A0A1E1JT69_9HELO|nr:uncharacterized protein RCO7_04681 [Rhynchosporium commune]